jgi:CYTH domain-containing protein
MIENERKFLCWFLPTGAIHLEDQLQFYIYTSKKSEVRVRIISKDSNKRAEITYKIDITNRKRFEITREIPLFIAKLFKNIVKNKIKKRRYLYHNDGYTWEIDKYIGNKSLIIAELENQDSRNLQIPNFIKYEVSSNKRYRNRNISKLIY